eukprot:GHUV01038197.1.p1 GENE.GHUV01038197.1~~GHUV01038197.1.p1  ORF type:complete len:167 (+),score=44.15 GHUV01038197.1:285-785(+)
MELLLQELDLAAAARDLPAAIQWLRVAEAVGEVLDRDASQLVVDMDDFPGWRHSYDAAVGLRKQQLVSALHRQLSDANASPAEIRCATRALADLVGEATALQAMLHCYSTKVQVSQALLLKQLTAGGCGCRFGDLGLACDGELGGWGRGERRGPVATVTVSSVDMY